jgi:hypothetical protein
LLVHATANVVVVIGTLVVLGAQAAAARRRLEASPEAPITRLEAA